MPDGYAMGPVEMTQAEIDEAITNRLIWEKIIVDRDSDPTDSSLKGGTAPN